MKIEPAPPKKKGRLPRALDALRRIKSRRETQPSPKAWAVSFLVYALGSAGVATFEQGFLLFAWLMCGPLALTIYLTFDGKGSLLNPYTLFFTTVVALSIAGYFYF